MVLGALMIFGVFILPIIQRTTDYSKNKIVEHKNQVAENREKKRIKNEINDFQKQYLEKKKTFKYLSDDNLVDMFENEKQILHPKVLLALEEVMVERKLIGHSPTHEKLQKIEPHFTNSQLKSYQRTSGLEIKQYATMLSFIIKNYKTSQKSKVYNMAKELAEKIFYSGFRDIDKIPISLNTISNPILDYKKIPNQPFYFAIWNSLKETILELPSHPDIVNEIYSPNECVDVIKKMIKSTSVNILKIENGDV
jgi:hypothetical protein